MIAFFLKGLVLGYGAAIPIGPINIMIMNYALQSYLKAIVFGAGAMSADVFYLILMSLGLLAFLHQPYILNVVGIFGGLFLLFIAYGMFSHTTEIKKTKEANSKRGFLSLYAKGFILTLLNPYTIGFWLSIATLSVSSKEHLYIIIFGLVFAIISWISLMPYFVYKNKHFISKKTSNIISKVGSLIIAIFAFSLLYETFIRINNAA